MNIIFDLESRSLKNALVLVHELAQATPFNSDQADEYVTLLKPLATDINWTKEAGTGGEGQFVIKGTGETCDFHSPNEVDKLWLEAIGENKPVLPDDDAQKKHFKTLAGDTLKTQPGFWKSFGLFLTELWIVCNRFFRGHSFRGTLGRRIYDWEAHIITYLQISKTDFSKCASTAIEYLCSHLDVVDGKVGRLLQFQALIFVAIATGAGTAWNNYHYAVRQLHPGGLEVLILLFWIGFGLWVLATAFCFWAVRRAAWGDYEGQETTAEAKKAYITFLILEVIKRTAKYRVAVPLSVASLFCLVACLPVLFILMR